jgi:hypothetical protein
VAAAADRWCAGHLGAPIDGAELFDASVGAVFGLRLRDGRRVVLKTHRPCVSRAYLEAMQTIQRALSGNGFPCPAPLVAPAALGHGTAVADTLLDRGRTADALDPAVRRVMAATLSDLVARCRPWTRLDALREHAMVVEEGRLWPRPHDGRFDFEATTAGAEWIDRVAAEARRIRDAEPVGDPVVGHTDWRPQNLRFADGAVSAVYDWDSLHIEREPVLVGGVARGFVADWSVEDRRQHPTLEEALGFLSDYERARGAPFGGPERRTARAALVYAMAYTARCEHSDAMTDFGERPPAPAPPEIPPHCARAFLAAHAAELLD